MGESNGSGEQSSSHASGTIAKLTSDILNDTFYNIVYDIVAKVHRDEKVARMRSAVVVARQKAEDEAARRREESGNKSANPLNSGDPDSEEFKDLRVETEAAIFEESKVYLKGNPLQTVKDIICPDCRLQRLLYPTTGVGARAPPDPYREYCTETPMINKPGHDIHGNPFATDKLNPKKKKQTTSSNTPASSPPTTPDGSFKHAAPEKISFPTVKCPQCPRYFVVTRVAQHMDRCMGLSGRQTSRNKTPMENGTSTPTSAPPKRPLEDDAPSPALTKKKKLGAPKKLSGKKPPPAPSSKLKNGLTPDMAAAADAAASGDADIKSEANGD
ncbi:transcriptional activator [Aspergillus affinis]|uniref:transcriptional activator n=1 Tax=Aspergillus affinis TaxID=1070780 RepID=UPI0022FF3F26|nr:transcriptional activator [Aspergillus affinis]KAI9044903.1 transcriptional activator [Aspergillus affinis]